MEGFMKKILVVLLALTAVFSVYAGKKFRKIGRYKNVEIIKITGKGIQISHEDGISVITERGLSARDKKLLASELEQYFKLKNVRSVAVGRVRAKQTEELAELMKKLPTMLSTQIEVWVKNRCGVRPDDNEFWAKFKKVFEFAENKSECHKMIIARMKASHNEEIEKLLAKFKAIQLDQILKESKKIFGVDLKDVSFRTIFENRYYMAENCEQFIKESEKLIAQYDREMERRRIEEERRRQEEERRRRAALAEQYYREVIRDFVPLANNYTRGSDAFLRELVSLKSKSDFVMSNASLTNSQHTFLKALSSSGFWAEHYWKKLNLASRYTNIYAFSDSNRCLREAREHKERAINHFNAAVRAYNAL